MKNKIIRSIQRLSIRPKIFTVFLISVSVYILLVTVIFWRILDQSTLIQLRQGTRQSSDLLVSGVKSVLENTRNISYSLMLNADIVSWLDDGGEARVVTTRNATQVLRQTYATFPGIASIYLFNNNGDGINASRHRTIQTFRDIRDTSWYHRAAELRGGSFVSLNADGTLLPSQNYNNISMIRQVLDVNTFLPRGFLIVNLNDSFISDTIRDISEKYDTTFYILDENGASVLQEQQPPPWSGDIPPDGVAQQVDGVALFLYKTEIPDLGWTVLSSTPYRMPGSLNYSMQMVFIPMLFAVGLYLLGSVYTANLVAKPVGRLISSMQGVREGRFEPVPPDERQDEFGQLTENYNIMIGEINALIQQRVLLERDKRRYELDILTQQFKPHFLYNTLDSISYLALSGNGQQTYETIVALSRFYRASVHKGLEVIPLSREIDMIRDYLILQKVRYGEMIDDRYDVSPDVCNIPVLRNVLQPLVENCIYHGIKPSGEPGLIAIKAWQEGDKLHILVEDDGVGMAPEALAGLDMNGVSPNASGIGLRGTIKRLQLFYGRKDVYDVTSVPGKGTSVLLKLLIDFDEASDKEGISHE